jgi:hypothetical protein
VITFYKLAAQFKGDLTMATCFSRLNNLVRSISCVVLMGIASPAAAAILVYEGFDPSSPPSDGATITGVAGATSVGFDGGSSWSDTKAGGATSDSTYVSAGLTFSTLPVAGGAIRVLGVANGDRGNASRPLSASATGTVYGSFLSRLGTNTDEQDVSGVGVTGVNSFGNGSDLGANTHFQVKSDVYQGGGNYGAAAIQSSQGQNTGTVESINTTYLVLFKMEGLVATSGTDVTQTLTTWILTATQYDALIVDGLTETELNTPSNVLQTGTVTVSDDSVFSSSDFLLLNTAFASNTIFDEIRISNSSLNEAVGFVPVPEPSAALLLIFGIAGALCLRRRQLGSN